MQDMSTRRFGTAEEAQLPIDRRSQQSENGPARLGSAERDFSTGNYVPEKEPFLHTPSDYHTIAEIDAVNAETACGISKWARLVVAVVILMLSIFLLVQVVLLWYCKASWTQSGSLSKRSETGALIGGVVGGNVILIIILGVCFYQMCR